MAGSTPTKKKKKKAKQQHATHSFAQAMSQAQLSALKPFIAQQVEYQGFLIQRKIVTLVMERLADVQTRQMALENLLFPKLEVDSEMLAEEVARIEDEALGFEEIPEKTVVEAGDQVRVELKSKVEDGEYGPESEKFRIVSLLREVDGKVQTLKEIEEALTGLVKGEELEVYIDPEPVAEGKEPAKEPLKGSFVWMKVVRVSRKPAEKPEDKQEKAS